MRHKLLASYVAITQEKLQRFNINTSKLQLLDTFNNVGALYVPSCIVWIACMCIYNCHVISDIVMHWLIETANG